MVFSEQHPKVGAEDRREVLERAADLLEGRYVLVEVGRSLARQLRLDAAADRWQAVADPGEFAAALTEHLRVSSGDGHLAVSYSAAALPAVEITANDAYSEQEAERYYGKQVNHGFEKFELLADNIGYLSLRVFAPSAMAGDLAAAAMTLLAQADAMIIDLRRNGGGHSDMVALLAAYLFDRSQPLSSTYYRPEDRLTTSNTPAWVPGRRYGATKPVYLLISPKTFSAAEHFAYDLQAVGRAVVVGEPSGGGAHPFEYRRLHPHFVLCLAESRSIHPITNGNWQGTGVIPDIAVPADRALDAALDLIRSR
jgi:C-terminal processing protease CtpA/Prc